MFLREVQVDDRVFDIGMPQQQLNGPQIRAGFKQVRGPAVAESILAMLMIFSSRRSAIVITLCMA